MNCRQREGWGPVVNKQVSNEQNRLGNRSGVLRANILRPLREFFHTEAIGGILLLVAAGAAIVAANSPLSSLYHHFLETSFRIGIGPFLIDKSAHHWINDGLMVVFFFLVGLEIKRELLVGELASFRKAALPLIAALGGVLFPAIIYLAINAGTTGVRGWAIPMATDIAFALGVLALLGKRVPAGILIFLTALAIADDLAAVLVIALFYGGKIALYPLVAGFLILAASLLLNKMGVRQTMVYVILGIFLWLAFLKSGVHSTVAGVLLAMTIPTNALMTGDEFARKIRNLLTQFLGRERVANPLHRAEDQQAIIKEIESSCHHVEAPLQGIEHRILPWVTYAIMPIFAFANAGVEIHFQELGGALVHPVTLGIIAGLVIGKQTGIMLFAWLAVKLGWAELPVETNWKHMYGVAWLAGIGFTMSLFIGSLAFTDPTLLTQTKIGILVASLASGGVGYAILRWTTKPPSGK